MAPNPPWPSCATPCRCSRPARVPATAWTGLYRAGAEPAAVIGFPAAVERYVQRVLRERSHPLMLSFDRAGNGARGALGDARHFGDRRASRQRRRGPAARPLPRPARRRGARLSFVDLPGGRTAHVHSIPRRRAVPRLLLDTSEEFERLQAQQQLGHEAALVSAEKSRALARLRQIRHRTGRPAQPAGRNQCAEERAHRHAQPRFPLRSPRSSAICC